MKRLLLILLLLPVFAAQTTYGQGWEWARSTKTTIGSEGFYIITDAARSVYGTGNHQGTIHFGTDSVTGKGVYIVKYDSIGNVKWAISTNAVVPTTSALGLTNDLFGNEYLLGYYDTTISFGGHILTTPSPRSIYYFIAKVDSTGTVKWIKSIGNVASYPTINRGNDCITTDLQGNIYVTCSFSNSPTIGSYSFTNAAADSTNDILVAKFDSSGTVIWAKAYGGKKTEIPTGISVTPSHHIYITGYFKSDTFFIGATPLYDTSTLLGIYYANFLAKLDSIGNPVWANWAGGSGADYACGLTSNSSEDVFVTGCYNRNSMSIGTHILPACHNQTYGYLAKYDSSGNVSWIKVMQGQFIIPWLPAIDPCGNIWVEGVMGSLHLVSNDTIDGHILAPPTINGDPNFIACWDNSGTYITATSIASGSFDDPNGIAIDRCGNVYVIADQEDCDTMIIATDTFLNTGEDMFVAKYNPNLGCASCTSSGINPITGHNSFCLGFTTDTLSDATTGGVWSSSNTTIATVGASTGIVTGVSLGVVTITYTIGSGYVTFVDTVKWCEGGVSLLGSNGSQIMVYPNPATTELTVASAERITTISITNLLGQVVHSQQYNSQQVLVDVADLPKGMYLLRINGSEVRKFVKE